MPIRILAIDGGGVGGAIPAQIIKRIVEFHPTLLEKTDLFAGTSTGGLIALALAKELSPEEVVALYSRDTKFIFNPALRRWQWEHVFRAKYSNQGLRATVRRVLGDGTLEDLPRPVLIPVTALRRPDGRHVPAGVFLSTVDRLFGSEAGSKQKYGSGRWSCVDAGLATSAAPTYFPAHRVKDPKFGGDWLLWDGGLVANNPALAAIAELYRFVGEKDLDFRILSLGTGYRNITIDAGDWGLLNSAQPVINALLDVSVGSTAFYLRQEYPDHYFRATPSLELDYKLDDASAVPRLLQVANAYCDRWMYETVQPDKSRLSLPEWLEANW